MSMRLTASIAMVLNSFKNIRLCNQGYYVVKIKLFIQTKEYKFYARVTKSKG